MPRSLTPVFAMTARNDRGSPPARFAKTAPLSVWVVGLLLWLVACDGQPSSRFADTGTPAGQSPYSWLNRRGLPDAGAEPDDGIFWQLQEV